MMNILLNNQKTAIFLVLCREKPLSGSLKDTQAVQSQTESVGDKYPKFDKLLGLHEGGYDDFNTPKGSKYAAHRGEEIADGKKLSDFTVGEIMQMQKNGELHAVGHYQITKDAMTDAVRLSGVSPDEKFTPEIQDKLFEDGLLKKAGAGKLYDYITGKSDDIDKAMLATAQEWAAFPVPHDMHITDEKFGDRDLKAGDSYYEGVKGNHSHMSLEDAKAAIEEMRANYLAAHSENNQTESTAKSAENLTVESVNQSDNQVSVKAESAETAQVLEVPQYLRKPEKHSQNNQTQTTDNAVKSSEVSGSLNKLPTDHLPKGVRRVSVKNLDEEKPIPCGANNPYKYDTVPYWVQEYAGRATTWQQAYDYSYEPKIKQGSDAKTAAEHYLFARAVQGDSDLNVAYRTALSAVLPLATVAYAGIKIPGHKLLKTSKTSWQQVEFGLNGWHDGLPFNLNKKIPAQLGVCIPKKDKK